MNLNLIKEIENMTINQIEEKLNSMFFTDNENKLFQKSKELIDQGYKMTPNDSGQKVLDAVLLYMAIKSKTNKE